MIPLHLSKDEAEEIASRATPEMNDVSLFRGTPKKVAAELQPYIEAGATGSASSTCSPTVLDPAEGEKAMGRSLELAGLLKGGGATESPEAGEAARA